MEEVQKGFSDKCEADFSGLQTQEYHNTLSELCDVVSVETFLLASEPGGVVPG